MMREIIIGTVLALLVFLGLDGVDIWPLVLLLGLGVAVYATGILNRLGTRNTRKIQVSQVSTSFQDIGGQQTAKNELKEALEFILKPEVINRLGIRPLKGILLTGPPGTGKTLLAKAAAQYTESVFLSASGSEFVEMYAGVGAQRVRQLFQDARNLARKEGKSSAIIFIDEIEVMAGKRGSNQSHLEYDQTLNQLLVEMDGMPVHGDDVRILVMAATNRVDLLDQALMRPGRFDRLVRVDLPDREGRLSILRLHTRNKPLDANADLDTIARETFGFSGAHLESVCNEAAILAMRDNAEFITTHHLRQAVDKVMLGERMDRTLRHEDLRRVAIHESGHAIVGELVSPGSVSSITIAPRGMALGFVRHAPEDDRLLQTVSELKAEIQVLLGGSTAERTILGEQSTGAANDFEKAWDVARQMVLSGLSPLGVIHEEALSADLLYQTIRDIIAEQQTIVDELISQHKEELLTLADNLLEHETLPGETVRSLIAS
ncbi:ATP-dependent metalloprotease FtsH [Sulfobacillus thermosulfidooxidans DSM 9293]|uniref:ATP-dependent metalloprotease FtsH n=2 Tax=Sulfobacillus thermosulfidooxidans TaxID=28034 RepID=A0A1W1WLF3_SULTA|nr:AAA family ATPase [Sulfobacillus thermosulfidooxidans]PSR29761.1 MAG: ATPase [Sulfobacillus thermosulfidooxidans]SMC07131.1 ATP-dependent metalloprotease FtsH [Sulfobacillus thermosulfidooxidans DSM 9293]